MNINSKKYFNKFTCIGFHSTPLPFGRWFSNSKHDNKGFKSSEVCAYRINSSMDAGPIYIRRKVDLLGSGNEIFTRIYKIIIKMIFKLAIKLPSPKKQIGKITYFKEEN